MDRTIIQPMEQMRDFDFVQFEHDVLLAIGGIASSVLSGLPASVVAGLIASQTNPASLTVNIASGWIYQFGAADATSVGSIAQDTTLIVQQGYAPPQTLTLVAPSAGQSQWNVIQAQFSQTDAVRTNDPNGGIVPFYNAANPTQPLTNSINTVRKGICVIQVITGSPATSGSETPPLPTAGWVPLYMIDLTGGQSQITTAQMIKCGPSVGVGVPANYPYAPFLAGFLASHHSGNAGQAPKISLTTEVQGVLPYANMSPVRVVVTGNLTLYVNASTGADTNNGLSPSTPFRTIQAAANAVSHNYDFNGFIPTISVANGTYTAGAQFSGPLLGTSSPVFLTGNTLSPQSVTITATNSSCVQAIGGANVVVQGFTMSATGPAGPGTGVPYQGTALYAVSGASIAHAANIFSGCVYSHIYAASSAIITNTGSNAYTVSGSSPCHLLSDATGFISYFGCAVTLSGTLNFTSGFAIASRAAMIQVVSGSTFTVSGSVTGVRYTATLNGVITSANGSATFFPGSVAGATSTGGQYS